MANLAGYGISQYGYMLEHWSRHQDDPEQYMFRYRNQNIDQKRTHMNYVLHEKPNIVEFVDSMIDGVDVKPRSGEKATNVVSDIVVTLPKNERLKGREREFFEQAYSFLTKTVPEELVIGAYVHMDETQPHMHFAFCPVVEKKVMTNDKSQPLLNADGTPKRNNRGTVRYKRVPKLDENGQPIMKRSFGQSKIFNRNKLLRLHPDLEQHMQDYFGFKTGIELEDKGEKILSSLDQPDYIAAKKALKIQREEKRQNQEILEKQDAEISKKQGLSIDLEKLNAELESRVASATNELENVETQLSCEQLRLERLRRSTASMESSVRALQERVTIEVAEFTMGKPGYADSPRWDALAIEQCDQECLGALGDVGRAAGELDSATRELAQTRESLASRIAALVERLTRIIVEKLSLDEWNPAHTVRNVGSDVLNAFDKSHQQQVLDATDAAVGRWEARRKELKPQMDAYAEKIDQRVKDFRKAAKTWQADGMTGEKPVFKLIKIPSDLAKYYEMETWEVRANAKDRVARARVKYGLENPAPGSAPLGGIGSYQQPVQRRQEPQIQQQQQQRQRNAPLH